MTITEFGFTVCMETGISRKWHLVNGVKRWVDNNKLCDYEKQQEISGIKRQIEKLKDELVKLEKGDLISAKSGRSNPMNKDGQALRPSVEGKS